MFDVDVLERTEQRLRAAVERLQIGMFDSILTTHLFHDELGIEPHGKAADPAFFRALEPDAERGPFSHVVGGDSKIAPDLIEQLPVRGDEHGAAGGRPGIPAGAAIGKKGSLGRQVIEQCGHPQGILSPMRNVIVRGAATALLLTATLFAPLAALAANTFYGITVHVSTSNIKVEDPKTKQTLSFDLVPKFDQIFSADGKTTYQMNHIKAGQYVGVIYDQKALGIRHADKIYLLNNANERIGKQ